MPDATVTGLTAAAYTVPTDSPESDGTLAWDATTIVVVEATGADATGLGYTYGPPAVAALVGDVLSRAAGGMDVLTPQRTWSAMRAALRNAGQGGIGALALSAADLALHDLRARVLRMPLARALGGARDDVPVYGSGGFTSYGSDGVAEQLGGWAAQGLDRVKMKVGRHPEQDRERLAAARAAIGDGVALMVDANGAFHPRQALTWAVVYAEYGVDWLEEPVSSDDLDGLRRVRDGTPGMDVAAGEYAWSAFDVRALLGAEAVDVLQADVTRCGGLTELVRIDGLAAAHNRPLSLHCAPAISAAAGCACEALLHLEYFHDHVRLETLLFDGLPELRDGRLRPDLSAAGNGLSLRAADAARFRSAG